MIHFPPDYCGSCYGAETPTRKCCNTCDELIKAYQEKDWNIISILRNSTQCIHDRVQHASTVEPGEGCTIVGSMKVNKVSGNFHIAHGESVVRDGRHMHHFNPALAPKFNVSHTINSLSFGDPYPNMPKNPLDSVQRIIGTDESTGLFQYFIKIIPTVYKDDRGATVNTNQYTSSSRFRPFAMPKLDGSSPVSSPLFKYLSLFYFFVSVCRSSAAGHLLRVRHLALHDRGGQPLRAILPLPHKSVCDRWRSLHCAGGHGFHRLQGSQTLQQIEMKIN